MATVERIKQLLEAESYIRLKDDAGVVTPVGGDAAIRCKAIKECLKIAEDEKQKEWEEAVSLPSLQESHSYEE